MPKKPSGMKEKATVIKKIVDLYLVKKLGYDLQNQLFFDEDVPGMGGKIRGYTDIEIRLDHKHTDVIIEAKRNGKKLTDADKEQAINYGNSRKVIMVVLTNAVEYQVYNSNTGNRLKLNGSLLDDIPRAIDLPLLMKHLGANNDDVRLTTSLLPKAEEDILQPCMDDIFKMSTTKSMADLERVFKRCHDSLRDLEKMTPEDSFEEFSKVLFLKLYSEKLHGGKFRHTKLKPEDINPFKEISKNDDPLTVKNLVIQNFQKIKGAYSEVFDETDVFRIKRPDTFKELVDILAPIDFDTEVDADVKGRAYEHFLATILKGSKLGQFFTPRPIVQMMVRLVNPKPGDLILDPACGSGGFLIKAMQAVDSHIDNNPHEREEEKKMRHETLRLRSLYGSDAAMVAKTAKMNMILAGDGHTNITDKNSLTEEVPFLIMDEAPLFGIILTNPPFGLKEKLSKQQVQRYDVPNSKAQSLFLQLMVRKAKPHGLICSVVDEGVLNTPTYRSLRKYLFRKCYVLAVFSLPVATFKPHYSGVKASVILMRRKTNELVKQDFPIFGYDLQYVGYDNTGKAIEENDIPLALEEWNAHVEKWSQVQTHA
jgi:type I restriction enzyme M protein